jgi:hypothetical protein
VTAPTQAPPRPAGPSPTGGPRMARVWTVVGVTVFLLIVLMWIWIFSGAPKRHNPDFIDDRGWAEDAEATCEATKERIDDRTAAAGTQDTEARADAIDASTDDLEAMLADLRDPLPSSAGDRSVLEPWLDDYAKLLDDRRTYADAVRVNPDARFLTTEKFNDPLDRVVQTFAEVNEMHSCIPAGDVG